MPTPRRKASIAALLIILIVPIATLVLVLFGAFGFETESRSQREAIRREAALLADQLAVGLKLPVWNFDHDQIVEVMASVMKNPDVFALAVRLADARSTLHALERDAQWKAVPTTREPSASSGIVMEERPIMIAGENLARIRVLVTPQFAEQRLRNSLFLTVSMIVALDLVLVLGVFLLLWRLVLRPLRLVELYAVGVSSPHRDDAATRGAKFHGEIERLRGAIESMVGILDSRYEALRRSEGDLERAHDSLAARNRELTLLNERLRESELRYREVFETTSDGIFVVDVTADRRFRLAAYNPAQERMVGIASRDAVGKLIEEYFPKEIADALTADNRACLEAGVPITVDRALDLHGGRRYFATTLIPVRDPAGTIHRIIGVVRDVTESRRAAEREKEQEKQLFQAAKLSSLGTLVSGIAHEINNPNNFIRLNSQNLKEFWQEGRPILDKAAAQDGALAVRGIPYETVRGMVDDLLLGIEEGSKRIEKLITSLRDFARGDEGDLSELVNVNAVIGSAVMIIRDLIQRSTASFILRRTPSLPLIRGSYHQIEQVVINLVTNACQALESRQCTVTVATSVEDGGAGILLEVSDEGIGIPEESLSRVADPFFTTKRDRGGSGLGLAVSSRIVQNHGGTMSFRSKKGRGTVVSVRLPVAGSAS
jgi:PAS domain S-box-containing protein